MGMRELPLYIRFDHQLVVNLEYGDVILVNLRHDRLLIRLVKSCIKPNVEAQPVSPTDRRASSGGLFSKNMDHVK
jgi:hypothetical protein